MDVTLINSVILAQDYEALVDWYIKVLDLDVKLQVSKDYHYTDLAQNGRLVVGICPAEEMRHEPTVPRNNSMVLQLSVSDIEKLFETVQEKGGRVLFGPCVDKNEGFKFGAFMDMEENQVWVIENFDFS